jgi:hypothetical protein
VYARGAHHRAAKEGDLEVAQALLHPEQCLSEASRLAALGHVALHVVDVAHEEPTLELEDFLAIALPGREEARQPVEPGQRVDDVLRAVLHGPVDGRETHGPRYGDADDVLDDFLHLTSVSEDSVQRPGAPR